LRKTSATSAETSMAALATIPTTAASTPAQDELDVMIGSD
jgi:hypothetical protein